MKSVASVKDRLNNKSKATGKTMQELLTAYGLERAIFVEDVSITSTDEYLVGTDRSDE